MNSKRQDLSFFSSSLIEWYKINKRDLPWREHKDPYKIWLSEVILQQTRVDQGLPYYLNFVREFPAVQDFANASLEKILKHWQGLGYYSRARNMHECAKKIVKDFDGQFPDTYQALLNLKGVGKYTAAAIGSICFDLPTPTIDGNAFRVLSRVFGMGDDIAKSSNFNVFYDKASAMIPSDAPGDFNQGLMEFGATVCTPRNPSCAECVFQAKCIAWKHDSVYLFPVNSKRVEIKTRYFNYLVVIHQQNILIKQRQKQDIWKGLYEFLLVEKSKNLKPEEIGLLDEMKNVQDFRIWANSPIVKHPLTHQKIYTAFFLLEIDNPRQFHQLKKSHQMLAVPADRLESYPVPRLIESFMKKELNLAW